ncbi:MAG: hypothetical protein HY675_20365 [Chloroflexi bacterium]|nr:hypothetical protein [Chloroflexota bacterium]
MPKIKLKAPSTNGPAAAEAEAKPVPLAPLNISGVVVRKKDLVEALRIYVPLIADIRSFEDDEQFYLVLDQQRVRDQSEAGE